MKRLHLTLTLLFAALLMVVPAKGQNNEISAGYGWYSANKLTKSYSKLLDESGMKGSEGCSSGAMYLTWRFKLLPKVSLGATLGYEKVSRDYPKSINAKNNFYTIAADIKFNYMKVPSGILTLYWDASLGATFLKQNANMAEAGKEKFSKTSVAYHVSPLGLAVGLPKFGVYGEVGYGYKGILQLGAYVKF